MRTARRAGLMKLGTRTVSLWLSLLERRAASPRALLQSYMLALATAISTSSQMRLWYSKMLCSMPWLISGW